jgi:hypothetical protein
VASSERLTVDASDQVADPRPSGDERTVRATDYAPLLQSEPVDEPDLDAYERTNRSGITLIDPLDL